MPADTTISHTPESGHSPPLTPPLSAPIAASQCVPAIHTPLQTHPRRRVTPPVSPKSHAASAPEIPCSENLAAPIPTRNWLGKSPSSPANPSDRPEPVATPMPTFPSPSSPAEPRPCAPRRFSAESGPETLPPKFRFSVLDDTSPRTPHHTDRYRYSVSGYSSCLQPSFARRLSHDYDPKRFQSGGTAPYGWDDPPTNSEEEICGDEELRHKRQFSYSQFKRHAMRECLSLR